MNGIFFSDVCDMFCYDLVILCCFIGWKNIGNICVLN